MPKAIDTVRASGEWELALSDLCLNFSQDDLSPQDNSVGSYNNKQRQSRIGVKKAM